MQLNQLGEANGFDLQNASSFELESHQDYSALLNAARLLEKQHEGWLPITVLDRFIVAYRIRAARLISKSAPLVEELEDFIVHLGQLIAPSSFTSPQDLRMRLAYDRLSQIKLLLESAQALKVHQLTEQARAKQVIEPRWRAICMLVLSKKSTGCSQAEITQQLMAFENRSMPLTKGAISTVLSRMRAAGLIVTTLRGKVNIHFPGAVLLDSSPVELATLLMIPTPLSPTEATTYKEILSLFFWSMCSTQAKLAEFNAQSGLLHKDLRSAVHQFFKAAGKDTFSECFKAADKFTAVRQKAQARHVRINHHREIDAVVDAAKRLTGYIGERMHQICEPNFRDLLTYFQLRGASSLPRISVKGFWPTPGDKDQERKITSLYSTAANPRESSSMKSSSTFQAVFETGRYRLVNDVPAETAKGTYRSSRFDPKRLELYRADPQNYPFEKCFIDYESAPLSKFYRSSLVVPISLKMNEELSEDFKNSWKNRFAHELNSSNTHGLEGRMVFGFLCLDHIDTNFFKDPALDSTDINMAYYFADILSLGAIPLSPSDSR
jgi:hypothetical protein